MNEIGKPLTLQDIARWISRHKDRHAANAEVFAALAQMEIEVLRSMLAEAGIKPYTKPTPPNADT